MASRYALAFLKAILNIEYHSLPGKRSSSRKPRADRKSHHQYYIPTHKLHQQVVFRRRPDEHMTRHQGTLIGSTLKCDARMTKMATEQPSGKRPPIFGTPEICSRSRNLAPALLGWTGHHKSVQSPCAQDVAVVLFERTRNRGQAIPGTRPEAAIADAILPRVNCALVQSRLAQRRPSPGRAIGSA